MTIKDFLAMFEIYYVVDYGIALEASSDKVKEITGENIMFDGEKFITFDVKELDTECIDGSESEEERQELIDYNRYVWGIKLVVERLNSLVLGMEIAPSSVRFLNDTDMRIHISPEDFEKVYNAIGRIDLM